MTDRCGQLGAGGNPPSINNEATLGLAGTANSLSYRIAEVENHFHSAQQVYGLTANTMARKSTSPIVVTGGSDDYRPRNYRGHPVPGGVPEPLRGIDAHPALR